jgi:hypothetical protein
MSYSGRQELAFGLGEHTEQSEESKPDQHNHER